MPIPFSKAEVFKNPHLSLGSKRKLVKIINQCLHFSDKYGVEDDVPSINSTHVYDQETHVTAEEDKVFEEFRHASINEYLAAQKIDPSLCYMLLYSLGNVNENQARPELTVLERISTQDFFRRVAKYL